MSTYGEKIRKYEARVRKALELELEPDKDDLKKLYYYVGRAEKKGLDHRTKWKDKLYWRRRRIAGCARSILKAVMLLRGSGII